jgi:hypothetical protein
MSLSIGNIGHYWHKPGGREKGAARNCQLLSTGFACVLSATTGYA